MGTVSPKSVADPHAINPGLQLGKKSNTNPERMQNPMSYDGRAVANFILDFCEDKGSDVTNLSLQKIVYFCHVWSLICLRQPLIRHKFEAWEYGPVLPYLYREFKLFNCSPIKSRAMQLDPISGGKCIVEYRFSEQVQTLLLHIVSFYSRIRASDLVKLTHAVGGPWHRVWHHSGQINPGMKIDDASIVEYYSRVPSPFLVQ